MKRLVTFTAIATITAFGFAGGAMADPFADTVESFNDVGGNGSNPGDATGTTDTNFAVLGDGGVLILKFTDNTCLDLGGDDVSIEDENDGTAEDYTVSVGLEGQTLASLGLVTETSPTDVDVNGALAGFTRIGMTDANQQIGNAGIPGAEIDSVECLNNLAFGTDHINKAVTAGGTSIVINSKNGADAQQFYSFEIVITNPDGADLSAFNFHDTVPGEFDVTAVVADNTASPTLTGCTNVAFAEHKPGNKLSPDKITWDVDLAIGESCTLNVDVETAQKNTSPKKVNFAPTECPAGGVVLNEGVEVHDGADDLILIDDSPIALTCVDPPADPD